jgi:hypothetical protein
MNIFLHTLHDEFQGTGDNFYKQGQLLPENFLEAARKAGHNEKQVQVRSQEGYDHSYYFVRPSKSCLLAGTEYIFRFLPLRPIILPVSHIYTRLHFLH